MRELLVPLARATRGFERMLAFGDGAEIKDSISDLPELTAMESMGYFSWGKADHRHHRSSRRSKSASGLMWRRDVDLLISKLWALFLIDALELHE